jgi:hypothetical protein
VPAWVVALWLEVVRVAAVVCDFVVVFGLVWRVVVLVVVLLVAGVAAVVALRVVEVELELPPHPATASRRIATPVVSAMPRTSSARRVPRSEHSEKLPT